MQWYQSGTILLLDINIKAVDPGVAERLADQAAAEGLSQQEWIRQVLRRTADRLSPAELLAQREAVKPMKEADFETLRKKVAQRHHRSVQNLSARQRGR